MNPISCDSHSVSMSRQRLLVRSSRLCTVLDVSDESGAGELLEGDIGDADVPDLALALQVLERADRLQAGDGRVGGVQLVEVDAVEFKPAQRRLAGGPQMVRAAVGRPPDQLAPGRPAAGPRALVA